MDARDGSGPGMNLAPVGVEHAHGDDARRPIRIHDELQRVGNGSCTGAPFTNDVGRTIKELGPPSLGNSPLRAWDNRII